MWIWEGYFHPNSVERWMSAAEKLRKINDHVLQDIEDYILLEGFKGKKPIDVKKMIDSDHNQRLIKKKNKSKEEEDAEKKQDKDR